MPKESGLGDGFYWGGYDLSGDVGSLQRIGGGPSPLVVTGINKSAFERIGGTRDGGIDWQTWFNPTSGQQHDRLKTLPTVDVIGTYRHGAVLGNAAASLVSKQANYDSTRGTDGSLSFSIQSLANGYGLEWGEMLTAGTRTDTGATNGTGVDFAASTSFGLQAYLQVTAFTGTSATIKLQESSDNGSGDAFADVTGGGFALVTGITTERIETTRALTVERYLRVVTTGTFSSLSFFVMVAKNATEVLF